MQNNASKRPTGPDTITINLLEHDVEEGQSLLLAPGGEWQVGPLRFTRDADGQVNVDVSLMQQQIERVRMVCSGAGIGGPVGEAVEALAAGRDRAQANVDKANAQLGEVRSHAAAALLGRGRTVRPDHDEAQLVEQLAGLVAEDAETFARQLGTIAHLEADVASERAGRLEAGRRAERDGKRLDQILDALAVEAGRGILRPLLRRLGRAIGGARG